MTSHVALAARDTLGGTVMVAGTCRINSVASRSAWPGAFADGLHMAALIIAVVTTAVATRPSPGVAESKTGPELQPASTVRSPAI